MYMTRGRRGCRRSTKTTPHWSRSMNSSQRSAKKIFHISKPSRRPHAFLERFETRANEPGASDAFMSAAARTYVSLVAVPNGHYSEVTRERHADAVVAG